MEEITRGLELSKINFIWVVRFPKGNITKVEEALPMGFLNRVGERIMVMEGCAPNKRVLGNARIGGFMSH